MTRSLLSGVYSRAPDSVAVSTNWGVLFAGVLVIEPYYLVSTVGPLILGNNFGNIRVSLFFGGGMMFFFWGGGWVMGLLRVQNWGFYLWDPPGVWPACQGFP